MFRQTLFFALLTLLTSTAAISAPPELQVDLATGAGTERTFQISSGDYQVRIINKVPKLAYSIEVEVSFITIPPLTPPGGGSGTLTQPCQDLSTESGLIRNATTEKDVADSVSKIEELLAAGKCTDATVIDQAKRTMASTSELLPGIYSLGNGQELKIAVRRGSGDNAKSWTYTFSTPERGHWFSSYGFVFVPNRDERYFSLAKEGESGKFTIARKADRLTADFAPSMFFSWLPRKKEGSDWSFSWSAGLGFDQSNPIVFLGPMWTYNQNISLVGGLVLHKQKRLNGIYLKGENVSENLTEEQLSEQTYRPNLFLGLSFRFSSNPFSTKSDPKPSPAAPK